MHSIDVAHSDERGELSERDERGELGALSDSAIGRMRDSELVGLSDSNLLDRQTELVAARRRIDVTLAAVAGEIARRSSREAGFSGLAQRHGHRSAEDFIATTTGLSRRESASLVRIATASSTAPTVTAAVESGSVSVAAADAILRGLGSVGELVTAEVLDAASETLLSSASAMSPEHLVIAARDMRAELDAAMIVDQERERRSRRALYLVRQEDGMTRLTALLDPESAALVRSVFDAITSPRRGGPRFVAAEEVERVARLERDPRTTPQIALDGFVELLRLGAERGPDEIVGSSRPAVRIHVTDADLRARGIDPSAGGPTGPSAGSSTGHPAGFARFEGEPAPVSIATAERYICTSGTVPIHFDTAGQVVNVGRERRLYSHRQRIGLAARDGGCRWPGCDRPPSWCEAHHIDEWTAHGGCTDLADGLLLCRFHHLMVHDRGWRIRRGEGAASATYWAERGSGRESEHPIERVLLPSRAPVRLVS